MKKLLIMMVACMALLSGCTESTIVKPTSETVVGDPNFETQENVEIDWTQVSTDAEDMFKDTSTYEYGRDFHFYMEPNKKQIMLIWVVADDLPDDQIGTYAEDLIKGFNDIVHTQDFSIEMSGEDSYGGLWKQYALSYSIVPESDQDNEDAWFISGSYEAGADFKLPDTKELISKVKEKEAAGECFSYDSFYLPGTEVRVFSQRVVRCDKTHSPVQPEAAINPVYLTACCL